MTDRLSICTFKWEREWYRSKFTSEHVNTLFKMIARNTNVKFNPVCITDNPKGLNKDIQYIPLWPNPCPKYGNKTRPNCYYRLKMFDPAMRSIIGKRFLWLDLDCVITGNIDHILNDQADFKIWRVDGEYMPCNGSMVLHRSGSRPHFWEKFNPNNVHPVTGLQKMQGRPIGSDQAWISTQLDDAHDQFFMKKDGVYSYRCHIKKHGLTELPDNASIVMFHGQHDPWHKDMQDKYQWVRDNYK